MDVNSTPPERMQVGELAERAGVSHRTVHYYERVGLLPAPERKSGGYRYYGPDALKRLWLIDRLKQLGLTLDEVRQVLPVYAADASGLRGKLEVVAILEQHLSETDRKLAQLSDFRDELIVNLAHLRRWIEDARSGSTNQEAAT